MVQEESQAARSPEDALRGLGRGSSGTAVVCRDAPFWMNEDIHQNRIVPPGVLKALAPTVSLATPFSDAASCVVPSGFKITI